MSQKLINDTKFKLGLTHNLNSFKNEIDYLVSVFQKWLDVDLVMLDVDTSVDLMIFYGRNYIGQTNSIIIHEEFFSKYISLDDNGVTIESKALNKIRKYAKNVEYNQDEIFVLFLKENCELVEYDHKKNNYKINFDLLGLIFFYITRIEELHYESDDHIHRFPLNESIISKLGIEKRATVDEAFCLLKDVIENFIQLPATPKMKVHLTHDVDRLRSYHGYYSLFREKIGQVVKGKLSILNYCSDIYHKLSSNEPNKSCSLLMDLSEAYNVKSTFLFLPYSKHPNDATYTVRFKKDFLEVVSSIKKRGHNIGFHPGWGTYNNHDEFFRQKSFLEGLIGQKVNVCRQHILRWNPHTWKIQSDCGITIDYTLAYPEGIAFRSQTTKSYSAYDLAHRKILPLNAMPTSIMEFALFMDKYGKVSKKKSYSDIKHCVDLHKKYGGDLVVLFHTVTVMALIDDYKKTLDVIFT
jgi:hypothetical protein